MKLMRKITIFKKILKNKKITIIKYKILIQVNYLLDIKEKMNNKQLN
jgi:hypothetical protein